MDTETSTIVYRHEYKYVLNCVTAMALFQELSSYLVPDKYSADGAYRVKSLYFDSLQDTDFWAKMDGENIRKKLRLRIYDEDQQSAKLELKSKEESLQYKSTLSISKNSALEIMDGSFSSLLEHPSDKALTIYSMMSLGAYRPSVLVEYDRYAFCYPEFNTRITFDCHVKSSETDLRLFERHNMFQNIIRDEVVLEVKFNNYLAGFIQDILSHYQLNQVAVSKYCNSRTLLV